jgi:hypothetical protein
MLLISGTCCRTVTAIHATAAMLEIANCSFQVSEFIDFLASSAGAWTGVVLAWLLLRPAGSGRREYR